MSDERINSPVQTGHPPWTSGSASGAKRGPERRLHRISAPYEQQLCPEPAAALMAANISGTGMPHQQRHHHWTEGNSDMSSLDANDWPDFLFIRHRDLELACGLELAGHLLTDIPITGTSGALDYEVIRQVATELRRTLKNEPQLSH